MISLKKMSRVAAIFLAQLSLIFSISPLTAWAIIAPQFPSCESPQGDIKAQYDSGTHGIVGNLAENTGSDAVYTIDSDRVMQCFCPAEGGAGTQTNWLKVSLLTDPDIAVLKSQGWLAVPTGTVWGLDDAPYLAHNSSYACRGGVGGAHTEGVVLAGATDPGLVRFPATGPFPIVAMLMITNVLLVGTLLVRKR